MAFATAHLLQPAKVLHASSLNYKLCCDALLQAASLAERISDPSWVGTIFAPTDDAFTALMAALNLSPTQAMADVNMITKVWMRMHTKLLLPW